MTETHYRQGTKLVARSDFTAKIPGDKGRGLTVRKGQEFWVSSASTSAAHKQGFVMVARKGKTSADAYPFDAKMLESLFLVS